MRMWCLSIIAGTMVLAAPLQDNVVATQGPPQKNFIGPGPTTVVAKNVSQLGLQKDERELGKLAFSLAEPDNEKEELAKEKSQETRGGFMKFIENVATNPMFKEMLNLLKMFTGSSLNDEKEKSILSGTTTVPVQKAAKLESVKKAFAPPKEQNQVLLQDEKKEFEASLSMDDAPMSIHSSQAAVKPMNHPKISDQEWSKTLFGERGVLTEIFHLIEEQRMAAEANGAKPTTTTPSSAQSDSSQKINGNIDFLKMFESLLQGPRNGEFGDPGPELPEFLGICNRLSCGDIYKAIDQFRRSEFFSNFQTGLQLIQDPKGWEIIGKALENPELISEFANTAGLQEMLGSAIGENKGNGGEKKKKMKTDLVPEDGDFGTDFTSLVEGTKPKHKPDGETLPEVSFSVDGEEEKSSGGGDYYTQIETGARRSGSSGGGDYYNQIAKNTDVDVDSVDTIDVDETMPPTTARPTTARALVTSSQKTSSTGVAGNSMPELSFSIDENEGSEIIETAEGSTFVKSVDVSPPRKNINIAPGTSVEAKRIEIKMMTTSSSRSTTTLPVTTTTRKPTTTRKSTTTTVYVPTTTRRNYRKDNDYYAMYYDDDRA